METVGLNVQTQIKFGLCKSNTNTVLVYSYFVAVQLSVVFPDLQLKDSMLVCKLSNIPGAAAFKSEVAMTH
jgi:hypothetical protein